MNPELPQHALKTVVSAGLVEREGGGQKRKQDALSLINFGRVALSAEDKQRSSRHSLCPGKCHLD